MKDVKVEKIRPVTLAIFDGTLGAVWGLALALVVIFQAAAYGAVVQDSFLQGLLFGLGTSAILLIIVPLIYFAIGWLLGFVHAALFNALARAEGGIEAGIELGENATDYQLSASVDEIPPVEGEYYDNEAPVIRPNPRQPAATFGERIPYPPERSSRNKRL